MNSESMIQEMTVWYKMGGQAGMHATAESMTGT